MAFEHSCRPCEGSGYYGSDRHDTCQVCRGRGTIHISGDEDDYQGCRPCEKSGYYGSDRKDTCSVCNGLGIVTKAYAD